jgi:hypothetical protein
VTRGPPRGKITSLPDAPLAQLGRTLWQQS